MKNQNHPQSVKTTQSAHPAPAAPAPFSIVGLGASAGGLEAFTELFKHLPPETGLGFVVVQHLDPTHESILAGLLAKTTPMPVSEVRDGMRVAPNHVYVIPPDTQLSIVEGVLKLKSRPQTRGVHRPIDAFFEALAGDQHEGAIGVVLSGTASDGTLGLEAIKAEGGITFAQDATAQYDSMPRSAVAAGCVDLVLPPREIARELARIARHPLAARAVLPPPAEELPPKEGRAARGSAGEDGYAKILRLLRHHSGVDFSLYKPATIQRRIARRIVLGRQSTLEAYAQVVESDPKELGALYSDLLISVTGFFRNPEAFEVLKRKVLPALVNPRREEPIRAWVVGCSTGQEAYSLAMTFLEYADQTTHPPQLQIFATDLNEELLEKARAGVYPKAAVQEVSPERLRRFFVEEQGGYHICKPLRQMVVFARQNLLADPPFSRLDLICCRNMLIYIEGDRQQEILPMFHYALKPEGILFLGASESIGSFTNLFEPMDKKYKIYLKKPGSTPALRPHFEAKHPGAKKEIRSTGAPESFPAELNIQREADRVALDQYTPPSVLVNGELQILHFRGDTSPFLKPPKGRASLHLLKMTREGLLSPLRAAFNKAKKDNAKVRRERVRITQNGQSLVVNLEVVPLKNLKERCFLVFFKTAEAGLAPKRLAPLPPSPAPEVAPTPEAVRARLAELEQELSEARDYLQAVQEQHEAALEELQASHEEISSANEELQSINEELETSKEELESSNEELTTLNQEMGSRNLELNRLNSDLSNLQASISMAILLLGRDLVLRQFTPQAEKLFNLLATDIGRPLSAVRHNLEFPDLESWAAEAIQTIRVREREVRDRHGHWYLLRARPYLTLDNKIDGAVLVLVDIDALKQAERGLRRSEVRYRRLFEASQDGVLILDTETRKVMDANPFIIDLLGYSHAELLGKELWEIGLVKDREASRAAFEQLRQRGDIHYEDLPLQTKAGERREVELIGHLYREDDLSLIECNIRDITQRKRDEAALREAQQQLQQHAARLQEVVAELEQYSYSITHDMRAPLRTMSMFSQLLLAEYGPKLDETGRENLQRIHAAARRLDHLIQDVLSYSRLSRAEMKLEPINLRQLVSEVIQHYPNLQSAQAAFEIQNPLLPVLAHRTALMQCLSNLLGNAVKFVAPGTTPQVKISSEPRDGQVRVWFADNGIGITPNLKERIWGIFQRGHSNQAYEGTGIGLSIVKKAIERMGGKVGVETEPGQGSRFWFQLPRAE